MKKTYIGFNESPEGRVETEVLTLPVQRSMHQRMGVWYVHLGVDLKDNTHETADLRIQIDRTDPRPIAPNVDQTLVPASLFPDTCATEQLMMRQESRDMRGVYR